MGIKSIIGAIFVCLTTVSFSANTAIISVDWKTAGDNLVTQITDGTGTSIEWLDFTETAGRSYRDVSSKFGVGDEFEGWRYATVEELSSLWTEFGGDPNFYNGWSSENNGLFKTIAPFMGDLYCIQFGCAIGDGETNFLVGEYPMPDHVRTSYMSDRYTWTQPTQSITQDMFYERYGVFGVDIAYATTGSALVRGGVVPIPSALWLFSSGLIGLVGIARRKNA